MPTEEDKKIDYVRRQLDNAANAGEIPWCMDDEEDRARMAEWFVKNILPL